MPKKGTPNQLPNYQLTGQTHLNLGAEQAQEVGVIPAGIELFAADTAALGAVAVQEVERQEGMLEIV